MLDFLIGAPYLIGQGQSGSYVDKAARAIPGMTPDKDTDIGRAAGQFLLQLLQSTPVRGRSGAKRAANKERQTKETELAAGAETEVFRPGAGFSGRQVAPISQVSPQDRAYAKERARVEAMVQSNPDMQKQDIAAARAKVRDQGLAEWAKANPELAKNVRPGQVGYEIARDVAYPMPSSLATLGPSV